MDKNITAVLAAAMGAFLAYFCQLLIPLTIMLVVIVLDYITGMIKAYKNGELSSRVGWYGILKKLSYLVIVCVAGVIDWLLHGALAQVGVEISAKFLFGMIVIVWLIINECISILENVAAIEGPKLGFMEKLLLKLKQQTEGKGNEMTDEEEKNE